MDNYLLVTEALEYIEKNLSKEIRTDDIAKALFCSKSKIEKLFRFVTKTSIRDYIIRRRMSKAAKDLVIPGNVSLMEIAFTYGYSSNEAFTRAFKKVWHCTPSEYRKDPVRFELFPSFKLETELMEDEYMKNKKMVDISELYENLMERRNCYIVGADIKGLIPINEISREAGDMAIITALSRLEKAAGEEDLVFRIGGDEFALVTNSEDKEYAGKIVNEVLSYNGDSFQYGESEIPLTLYATCFKIQEKSKKYATLFSEMQYQIDAVK